MNESWSKEIPIMVAGAGRSGLNAVRLLQKAGFTPVLYDENAKLDKAALIEKLDGNACEIILGELKEEDARRMQMCASSPGIPLTRPFVKVLREAGVPIISEIALAYHFHKGRLIAVTGTNGKTTTVTLLYNLFMGLGYNCGLLSTIANFVGTKRYDTPNTTSDPITINSLLAEMVQCGCQWCFMEVSSIGMEQERVSGLEFKAGIFSNLTHDHLDYHKTFAEYLRCKKLFFDSLPKDAFAITNADDKNGMTMVQNTKAKIVTYALRSMADHRGRIIEESFEGMCMRIDGKEAWTKLIGRHNAYNIMAIYTTAVCLGTDPDEALLAISSLDSAKGRLENLRGPKGLSTVIDYAHTPDAMQNVLSTLRDIAPERELICLFGCGGDRDRTKRPEMAEVAEKYADRIIVTSDNSRSEKTEDIFEDIRKGFSIKGLSKTIFIADRREAIRTAIILAPENSTILLAGKGHETYQILGGVTNHFDEREIVQEVYKTLENQ